MSNSIITNQSVGKQEKTSRPRDCTRSDLAACAAKFFAQQGYYGTSTQTIAEYCNIRKASLFHHYKTKEEIALAAIQYVHNECDKHVFAHAAEKTLAPKQRAHHFLEAAEHFFNTRAESLLPVLLGLELNNIEIFAKAIKQYFQSWLDALITVLHPLCDNAEHAKTVAIQTMTRMQGYMVTNRLQKEISRELNILQEVQELWREAKILD